MIVPSGIWRGAVSSTNLLEPGSLIRTLPALTFTLTVLPACGGGSTPPAPPAPGSRVHGGAGDETSQRAASVVLWPGASETAHSTPTPLSGASESTVPLKP